MEDHLIGQKATNKGSIPSSIFKCISKGIARVDDNGIFTITLMKLPLDNGKTFYYLITCAHCIKENDIKSKIEINISYEDNDQQKEITIKLDEEERFIKCYSTTKEKLDITVVQVFNNEITEDKNFILPDLTYRNGYKNYINNTIFVGGYPYNKKNDKKLEESDFSNGKILNLKKTKYLFGHNCSTYEGSSGSPLINCNKKLIGVHNGGFLKKIENGGTFIGPIIEDLINNENNMKENKNINVNMEEQEKNMLLFLTSKNPQTNFQINDIDNIIYNAPIKPLPFKTIIVLIFIIFIILDSIQYFFIRKRKIIYYKNGNKKFEGYIRMGSYDGPGKEYNENGKLLFDGYFKRGKKSGEGKDYYQNGSLKYYGNYSNNEFDGKGILYDGKKRKLYDGEFFKGKRHGNGIEFYKNGNKHHEGNWKDNKLNGFTKTYYQTKNDFIEQFDRCEELPGFDEEQELKYNRAYNKIYEYICYEGNYVNGSKSGHGTFFYINEVEKYEGEWENDKKNGYGLLRDINGLPLYQGFFKNNIKTTGTIYGKNGIIYYGHWINGILDGYGTIEYKKEQCLVKGYFVEGKLDGIVEIWLKIPYEMKLLSGNILNGKFDGWLTLFRDNNRIDLYFKNGKQLRESLIIYEEGKINFQKKDEDNFIKESFSKCSILKNLTNGPIN